jgi:hypothetical protein
MPIFQVELSEHQELGAANPCQFPLSAGDYNQSKRWLQKVERRGRANAYHCGYDQAKAGEPFEFGTWEPIGYDADYRRGFTDAGGVIPPDPRSNGMAEVASS